MFFNEYLQVEKFIKDKFCDFKCYLVKKKEEDTSNLTKMERFNKAHKEKLHSILEPDRVISRDVFRNPNSEKDESLIFESKN